MSITIPVWCLWLIGVPLGIVVLGTAIIGLCFIISFAGVRPH